MREFWLVCATVPPKNVLRKLAGATNTGFYLEITSTRVIVRAKNKPADDQEREIYWWEIGLLSRLVLADPGRTYSG